MMERTISMFTATIAVSFTAVCAGEWTEFRGPLGQGVADVPAAPLRWSEEAGVVWKTTVEGRGWSSPVVLGDQVWLTSAIETPGSSEDLRSALDRFGLSVPSPHVARSVRLTAVAIDRRSGRPLRSVTLFDDPQPVILCSVNSYASPTPVAEPGRLYCDFGAMGTACLDGASGEILWTRRLEIEHQVGPGSSPILHGGLLILTRDGCDRQYVTALDKRTGATVWQTERPPLETPNVLYRKGFSTPLVFTHGGTEQMVSPGAQWIVSYEPASGKELWRVDTGMTYSNAARPVYGCGLVFCATAYGGSWLVAIRPDGRGEVSESHVAWKTQRGVPKRSSPLLVGDELYMVADNGAATCLDARTGHVHWSERLPGNYSASPTLAAGRIYFFSESGVTTVIEPGRQFTKLAENTLDGRIMASPAVVDDGIFLRTATHLYRIR